MDVSAAFGDVSVAVAFVGLMAFLVSVITEGLKLSLIHISEPTRH